MEHIQKIVSIVGRTDEAIEALSYSQLQQGEDQWEEAIVCHKSSYCRASLFCRVNKS